MSSEASAETARTPRHAARHVLRDRRIRIPAVLAAIYVVASVAYVVICVHLPVQFNSYAGMDDAFFILKAQSLFDGDWLGPYDRLTLIKGPGFVYFLALNHFLGLSSTFTLSVVYVAACALFAAVVHRVLGVGRVPVLVLYLGLLYQPALMPSRVIRDAFYQSLVLMTLAGIIALVFSREHRPLRYLLWGLPLGMFWITREEGIWILPAFGLLLVLRAWRERKDLRAGLAPFVGAVAAFAVGASVPVLGTSAINRSEYGSFTVTDLNAAPFQSTMRLLDSISAGKETPHVLVSNAALEEAFRVSPAFAELRPTLMAKDNPWLVPGCETYRNTCGQFGGGWFGWAVRDAVSEAGHYASATEATRYYERVAAQLRAACDSGRLTCRFGLVPVGPVADGDTLAKVPSTMFAGVRLTLYGKGSTLPLTTTVGTDSLVREYRDFLGDPLTTERTPLEPSRAVENASRWVKGKEALADVCSVVAPVIFVAGLLAFAACAVLVARRRPVSKRLLVAAAACWILYATRLGLVALIDITSSPGISAEYLAPAFQMVWIASVLSLLAVLSARRASLPPTQPVA